MTNMSRFVQEFLRFKIESPTTWEPLSPRQTRMADHHKVLVYLRILASLEIAHKMLDIRIYMHVFISLRWESIVFINAKASKIPQDIKNH